MFDIALLAPLKCDVFSKFCFYCKLLIEQVVAFMYVCHSVFGSSLSHDLPERRVNLKLRCKCNLAWFVAHSSIAVVSNLCAICYLTRRIWAVCDRTATCAVRTIKRVRRRRHRRMNRRQFIVNDIRMSPNPTAPDP